MIARAALLVLVLASVSFAQATKRVPTIDELLTIETVSGPQISPDGKWVAYVVNSTDFKQDIHPTQIWLANVAGGETFQLTSGMKPSSTPRWSPDGRWLGFLSSRLDDRNQIFAIRPTGGEAVRLTKSETAVNDFAWAPDGKTIALDACRLRMDINSGRRCRIAELKRRWWSTKASATASTSRSPCAR